MMYSTRKLWRILVIIVFLILLAGKVPWRALTAQWGLWRTERQTGRVGERMGDRIQRVLDRIEDSIK
jgi:hypothetical protein